MKKLIFGLATFFTSVLGIIGSMAVDAFGNYIYAAYGDLIGLMGTESAYEFAFVITAAIGFVFALIGALTRDKKENQ